MTASTVRATDGALGSHADPQRRPHTVDARATVLGLFLTAVGWVHTAEAQGLGYAVAGPAGISGFFGSSSSSIHAAGGGELMAGGYAGVGGEVGVLANSSSALVVLSINGVVHISAPPSKVSPFATAGYTHMGSGEGSFHAWNVGGGVDVWMKDHVGLRVDVRDHVRPDDRGTVQYWTVRAGVTFR